MKGKKMTNERYEGKYSLGRARPALLAALPGTPLSIPILIQSSPGRHPATYPRVFQELNHRLCGFLLPQPSQRWCPRVLPVALRVVCVFSTTYVYPLTCSLDGRGNSRAFFYVLFSQILSQTDNLPRSLYPAAIAGFPLLSFLPDILSGVEAISGGLVACQ